MRLQRWTDQSSRREIWHMDLITAQATWHYMTTQVLTYRRQHMAYVRPTCQLIHELLTYFMTVPFLSLCIFSWLCPALRTPCIAWQRSKASIRDAGRPHGWHRPQITLMLLGCCCPAITPSLSRWSRDGYVSVTLMGFLVRGHLLLDCCCIVDCEDCLASWFHECCSE